MARIARFRNTAFLWGSRTYIMGIVNATPDSFSGDGRVAAEEAIAHALRQLELGADLLDIGAESTRPGHTPLAAQEELARLIPVVRAVRERAPEAVLSIDTFKPAVFREAHAAGGDILNSIWGLRERALLDTALACEAPLIIMHNKAVPRYEGDVVDEVLRSLEAQALAAVEAGMPAEHILLDPGIGFGKLPEHNLAVLGALERLVALGFPTLLGTSRKSTIGALTGKQASERTFGTAATVAMAAAARVDIVRVHDVAAMQDVTKVVDAVERGWRPQGWKSEPA